MKKLFRNLIPMLVLSTLLVSACTGVSAPLSNSGGSKVEAALVEFTGVIEAINGDQWTVGGQVITVDPSVLRDGPFNVGDTIKVEVDVQQDGSIVVTRVETSEAADTLDENNSDDGQVNDDDGDNNNSDDGLIDDDDGDDNSCDGDSIDDSSDDDSSCDDDDSGKGSDDHGDDDNSGSGS